MRCERCCAQKLVTYSCNKRGYCPSCDSRRMAGTAALLADEVLPVRPLQLWVLSLPPALPFLPPNAAALTHVLGVGVRILWGGLSAALGGAYGGHPGHTAALWFRAEPVPAVA